MSTLCPEAVLDLGASPLPRVSGVDDLDGDGELDVFAVVPGSPGVTLAWSAFEGPEVEMLDTPGNVASVPVAWDRDGDGTRELVVARKDAGEAEIFGGRPAVAGDTVVLSVSAARVGGVVTDLDGDDRDELVLASASFPTVQLDVLDEGGIVSSADAGVPPGFSGPTIAAGDLDGDGATDVAVGGLDGVASVVLWGQGDGTLGSAAEVAGGCVDCPAGPVTIRRPGADRDDLVVTTPDEIQIWSYDGADWTSAALPIPLAVPGSIQDPPNPDWLPPRGLGQLLTADLDGDGASDIVNVAREQPFLCDGQPILLTVYGFLHDGDSSYLAADPWPILEFANDPAAMSLGTAGAGRLVVHVADRDGKVDRVLLEPELP